MPHYDEHDRGYSSQFEDMVRRRYRTFRSRSGLGLSSLVDLISLILVLIAAILFLSMLVLGLLVVLVFLPFLILAGAALSWLGLRRVNQMGSSRPTRDPDVTIIDVEPDRS